MGKLPEIKYYVEFAPYGKQGKVSTVQIDPKRINNTLIPEGAGNTVLVYCVVEQDVRYSGEIETLRSDKYVLARLDLSMFGMTVHTLDDALQRVNYIVAVEKNKIDSRMYVDYNKYHIESDGVCRETPIASDGVINIKVPKWCKRFMTYNRLESTFFVNGEPLRLRSDCLNAKNYHVGDVEKIDPTYRSGYRFVTFKDGSMAPLHDKDSVISPNQIGDDGDLSL